MAGLFGEIMKESDKKLVVAEALKQVAIALQQSKDITAMESALFKRSEAIKEEGMKLKGRYR